MGGEELGTYVSEVAEVGAAVSCEPGEGDAGLGPFVYERDVHVVPAPDFLHQASREPYP